MYVIERIETNRAKGLAQKPVKIVTIKSSQGN
jgi:hypothetical protein